MVVEEPETRALGDRSAHRHLADRRRADDEEQGGRGAGGHRASIGAWRDHGRTISAPLLVAGHDDTHDDTHDADPFDSVGRHGRPDPAHVSWPDDPRRVASSRIAGIGIVVTFVDGRRTTPADGR
nr:hypothetical protein KPHV_81530 [Kitasatospora purpeofusca]